jgi:hypothetical protein
LQRQPSRHRYIILSKPCQSQTLNKIGLNRQAREFSRLILAWNNTYQPGFRADKKRGAVVARPPDFSLTSAKTA